MKTVQDYLDLGLAFVSGDKICGVTGVSSSEELALFGGKLCEKKSSKGAVKIGVDCYARVRWTPSSFAWRNNSGVKPEYEGLIDVEMKSGVVIRNKEAGNLMWSLMLGGHYIISKWRPVVLQSESPTVSPKEDKTMNPSREPKAIFSTESTMFGDRLRRAAEVFESGDLDISISDGKPVYTAEMHAKNELPPVGSKVKVCIEEAGFYVDEQDVKFEGKAVTVKAAFSNTESEKIVAVENEDGNCYCYIIECIKPIIKTIKVNGFDVPAPMSEAPAYGDRYFISQAGCEHFYVIDIWVGDSFDSLHLSRGLVHSTTSAAIAHAKAMLGIDPNA